MSETNHLMPSSNNSLKDSILKRITAERITPRSRLYWLSHEYALWGAFGATVLLGALSLAVVSFASVHVGYALYEATHDNYLTFLVDSLPSLWLGAFVLLLVASYFNLRHTKRGYKYPVVMVVGSSIGFSVLGGALLHALGAGYYFDQFLGRVIPQYQSREEMAIELWQKPAFGRLVGQVEDSDIQDGIVPFIDADNHEWRLRTDVLAERDAKLLASGKVVRILAATSSAEGKEISFACLVLPWNFDHPPIVAEMRANRKELMEEIHEKKRQFIEAAGKVEEKVKDIDPVIEAAVEKVEGLPLPDILPEDKPIKVVATNRADTPCARISIFKQ